MQGVTDFFWATDFVLRSKNQPKRASEEGSAIYLLLLLGDGAGKKKLEFAELGSAARYVTRDNPIMLVFMVTKTILF